MTTNNHAFAPTTFQEALLVQAGTMQEQVDSANRQLVRAQREIDRLKSYVDNLNALLESEGLAKVSLRDPVGGRVIGKAGNRSPNMPQRKPEYEGMSLEDAIETVLNELQDETHADVLVERVYEISTELDKKHGKRSLTSSARSGAKKGRWEAIPGNLYRAKQPEMQLN
ncbi:MAG: hypothetical protein IH867_00815 [Chloroflexi bacterium]|nr:hypothetical protein [Chloroflexota bacterium]